MRHLIIKIGGNKYANHSFFRPYLYIYDDILMYTKRRNIFFVDEITMPYNHIAYVNMHKGILFAKFEIAMSGGNNTIFMKGVWNKPAKKIKKLIDKKIYHSHNSKDTDDFQKDINEKKIQKDIGMVYQVDQLEKGLARLSELLQRGKLSKEEFKKQKAVLLKRFGH